MNYYLSSLKYPLDGEAIVPFMLGAICIFVNAFLLKIDLLFLQISHFSLLNYQTYAGIAVMFFLLAFLSNMVLTSSEGKDTLCDSPQFIERFEDVVVEPGFRSCIVVLTYILPFLISLVLEEPLISGFLLLAGGFFLPVAYMRTCIMESLDGMNPVACLRFFGRAPGTYANLLLMSLIWAALLILPYGILVLFLMNTPKMGLGMTILFNILNAPYTFYITAVYMNVLGKFYRKNEEIIEQE